MIEVRYMQTRDEEFWFRLDQHLAWAEFQRKVRDKMGYVLLENNIPGGLIINIPKYEQPMELFMIKETL